MIKFGRKGFTLVEIMIVILVIGILAAAFVYSSTEAITTAKATKIIANLHTVRNAVLQFYADYPDVVENMPSGIQNYLRSNKKYASVIQNYIDDAGVGIKFQDPTTDDTTKGTTPNHIPVTEGYYGVADAGEKDMEGNYYANNRGSWYVGYGFKADEDKVRDKVKARAKSEGLLFSGRIPNFNVNVDTGEHDVVWLKVFGEWKKPTDE